MRRLTVFVAVISFLFLGQLSADVGGGGGGNAPPGVTGDVLQFIPSVNSVTNVTTFVPTDIITGLAFGSCGVAPNGPPTNFALYVDITNGGVHPNNITYAENANVITLNPGQNHVLVTQCSYPTPNPANASYVATACVYTYVLNAQGDLQFNGSVGIPDFLLFQQ